uniref:Secreted protein n=1 Tax=Steinernema glaseri TaxID=37863 RepID=A0A1I7ZH24_9BILA
MFDTQPLVSHLVRLANYAISVPSSKRRAVLSVDTEQIRCEHRKHRKTERGVSSTTDEESRLLQQQTDSRYAGGCGVRFSALSHIFVERHTCL